MALTKPRGSGWSLALTYAVALHIAIACALFVSWRFMRQPEPAGATVLHATMVREPAPETSKEPPAPRANDEQKIKEAEQTRLEVERRRLEAEKQKLEIAQHEKEEAERKNKAAEAERKKQEAQKKKADQQRKQAEQELRDQLEVEEQARAGERKTRLSSEMAKYRAAIQQRVVRNWSQLTRWQGMECVVRIRQSTSGEVLEAVVTKSSGDASFDRSVEAAVRKASPLPLPTNPELFERDVEFTFRVPK